METQNNELIFEQNKNGKAISCWVNLNQQKMLIEKYGKLPDSKIILHVLLEKELKIITPEIRNIQIRQQSYIYELKQIGKNLNQLVKILHKREPKKYNNIVIPLIKKLNQRIFQEEKAVTF